MNEDIKNKLLNRRSIRQYKKTEIDIDLVKESIEVASKGAPNGANMQPWKFVLVQDQAIKDEIRKQAEAIEKDFYDNKIGDTWKKDLEHLKTNYQKPFLSEAQYLIVVFEKRKGDNGEQHYYTKESTGIAIGMLINALTLNGLDTLTYTPAPTTFLSTILDRPSNEKPVMVLPVGLRKDDYEPINVIKKDESDYLVIK